MRGLPKNLPLLILVRSCDLVVKLETCLYHFLDILTCTCSLESRNRKLEKLVRVSWNRAHTYKITCGTCKLSPSIVISSHWTFSLICYFLWYDGPTKIIDWIWTQIGRWFADKYFVLVFHVLNNVVMTRVFYFMVSNTLSCINLSPPVAL